MKNTIALTKRNCLLFLRNKSTVFFSFLSSIIVVSLYFLFIAKLYKQGFNEVSGLMLTSKQLNGAIYAQMIVGVLVLNSVSISTGIFGLMANDLENRKTDALLLTKLTTMQFVLSYLFASVIVCFGLNLLMWLISVVIIGISTGIWISLGVVCAVIAVLLLVVFVSCSMMLLITTIVKSSTAIGVINGVLGTLLGFLCGIYMPFSNLGKGATYVGSLLPFTHLTIWLKNIVLSSLFKSFGMPKDVANKMQEMWFSAGNVGLCGANVPLWVMIMLSTLIGLACLVVAVLLLNKKLHSKKHVKSKIIKNEKF